MACEACERIRYNMASDPEMNRGEIGFCEAHRQLMNQQAKPSDDEITKVFEEWFAIRHRRLTKEDRKNPAFHSIARLAFEAGLDFLAEWRNGRR